MKNYIKIQNNGEITKEDLIYIGSSTKRNDSSKIGQFGSGWKFALAWILRNDLQIKIYSGETLIPVDFTVKEHRDELIKVLVVDNQETSITSGMGEIDWKGWMALREIVSNAIDEGGHDVTTAFNPTPFGVEGMTNIWIEMSGELATVLQNWDRYFSFNRKATYQFGKMKIYKKESPSQQHIFRKGILCLEMDKDSLYDLEFEDIDINESRLADSYGVRTNFRKEVKAVDDPLILKELLTNFPKSYFSSAVSTSNMTALKSIVQTHTVAPFSLMTADMILSVDIYLPDEWYKTLRDLGLCEDVFERFLGGKQVDSDFYVNAEFEIKSQEITYKMGNMLYGKKIVFVKFLKAVHIKTKFKDNIFFICDSLANSSLDTIFAEAMYALERQDFRDIFTDNNEAV